MGIMTIQEQLRQHAAQRTPRSEQLMREAADRIDALEAALREIDQPITVLSARRIAREALESAS